MWDCIYMQKKNKHNPVLAGNKWLITLCVVFGKWESSNKTNPGISVKFCNTANCTGGNYNVNKYRIVFIRLIKIYVASAYARSERSRVGKKWHPGGDCAQGPQCSPRKWRAHLHETTDGECECHKILLSTLLLLMFFCKYWISALLLHVLFGGQVMNAVCN